MSRKYLSSIAAIALLTVCVVGQPVSVGHTATVYETMDEFFFTEILSEMGIDSEIKQMSSGRPYIYFVFMGAQVSAVLYEQIEDTGSYGSLLFSSAWSVAAEDKLSLSAVNEWNAAHRWARLYLDDVNDPWLEFDMLLDGGVSLPNIKAAIYRFITIANSFEEDTLGW